MLIPAVGQRHPKRVPVTGTKGCTDRYTKILQIEVSRPNTEIKMKKESEILTVPCAVAFQSESGMDDEQVGSSPSRAHSTVFSGDGGSMLCQYSTPEGMSIR